MREKTITAINRYSVSVSLAKNKVPRIANKQANYFLLIRVADDVIARTSTEKKTLEEAMKRAKKEVVLPVQKV